MCEQPSDQDYAAGLKKQQMVMEFDMATWKVGLYAFLLDCLEDWLYGSEQSKYSISTSQKFLNVRQQR